MVSNDERRAIINRLTDVVASLQRSHPTRVAVDGRSAAGKTTFADELADALATRGREVIRASIDDFHRPGHKYRSQRGGWTPRSYYDEGFDYSAVRQLLLVPLGPIGNRRCRTMLFDAYHDTPYAEEWHEVEERAVAVVDGVFLLRTELAEQWDYVIWLDIDWETMVERARKRDSAWAGSEEVVEKRYREHWIPTHLLYERLTGARDRAQAIIDNRDPQYPRLLRLEAASPGWRKAEASPD